MTLTHIPQTVANGHQSMMRNMFLVSSIGFGVLTFSDRFKKYKNIIKILGYTIFIYSVIYGLKSANDFNNYLNYIENNSTLVNEDKIQLKNWNEYDSLTYIYSIIIIVFICIMIIRDLY